VAPAVLIGLALVPSALAVRHPVDGLDLVSSSADLVVQVMLTATGLLLLWDHEHRRSGVLLVLAAVCIGVSDLAWTDLAMSGGWWREIGSWAHWSAAVFLLPVVLAYPAARLGSSRHRLLVGLAAAVLLGWRAVETVLFRPSFVGYTGPIRWMSLPGTSRGLYDAARMVGVVLSGVLCVCLVIVFAHRWRDARSIARWPTRMTAGIGLALTTALAIRVSAEYAVERGWVASALADIIAVFQQLLLAAAPIGLLAVALRAVARRGLVLERMLEAAGDPVALEWLLRSELADPQLRLLYPVGSRWLDGHGSVVGDAANPPIAGSGRVLWSGPARRAQIGSAEKPRQARTAPPGPAVLIDVDEQARLDPARLRTTLTAAAVVLENTRLAVERDAGAAEVAASRARIVEAAMAQRRRLERDLHDGAQQHLLTVAATLARAGMAAEQQQMRSALDQARTQLATALTELRNLARGIHPAALSQGGLVAGVESLAAGDERLRVEVGPGLVADVRLPEAIEAAAYFMVLEAVTNARKHAAPAQVTVTMSRCDHELRLAVADRGGGGARLSPKGGLAGLADRITALGGTFAVNSPVGVGTVVSATLPCDDMPVRTLDRT